jgi:phospholipid transport system substrate-binding protein
MTRFTTHPHSATLPTLRMLSLRSGWARLVMGLVFACGLAFSTTASAQTPTPKERVDTIYGHIKKAAETAESQDKLIELVTSELDVFIDYQAFSARTLRTSWPTLSDAQKATFIDRFKRLIIKTYAKKFQPGTVFEVEHRGESSNKDKSEVTIKTTVRGKKVAADVDYLLTLDPKAGPRAIDIVIDDVSMALNWRKQFERIIAKDGFDALIARINKRVETGEEK